MCNMWVTPRSGSVDTLGLNVYALVRGQHRGSVSLVPPALCSSCEYTNKAHAYPKYYLNSGCIIFKSTCIQRMLHKHLSAFLFFGIYVE